MRRITYIRLNIALLMALSVAITGCEKRSSPSNSPAQDQSTNNPTALPGDLFVTQPIAGARGVADIKNDAAATGEIVITGRIGGRVTPFVAGAAMFILTDSALKSCDQIHGDTCKSPWDYCCETSESLLANTATIRVTGEDGKPLSIELRDQHGLAPLATVTIAGTVTTHEDNQLVIDAKKIFVQKDTQS